MMSVWLKICKQKLAVCICENRGAHYANRLMQYTAIFHSCKNVNFQMKKYNIFLIFAQNIDCGYTLEPPYEGGSNEYPQSMFYSKNKKKCIPLYTPVSLYKSGV